MPIFHGLGRALRWLRDRQGKRQYQVAEAAGVTKAMLSAYETGKQKPSLDTLEKILEALGCDLSDLHGALQIVNERPTAFRRADSRGLRWHPAAALRERAGMIAEPEPSSVDVYRSLGIEHPLPPEQEQAYSEMLSGFCRLLRYWHRSGTSASEEERADILP